MPRAVVAGHAAKAARGARAVTPPPDPNTRWLGVVLVVIGAVYALLARQIRDWQVRSLQRGFYLTMTRLSGIAMVAIGLAILLGLIQLRGP